MTSIVNITMKREQLMSIAKKIIYIFLFFTSHCLGLGNDINNGMKCESPDGPGEESLAFVLIIYISKYNGGGGLAFVSALA